MTIAAVLNIGVAATGNTRGGGGGGVGDDVGVKEGIAVGVAGRGVPVGRRVGVHVGGLVAVGGKGVCVTASEGDVIAGSLGVGVTTTVASRAGWCPNACAPMMTKTIKAMKISHSSSRNQRFIG